jgi:DNA-binding response OmpR family regulator
VTQPQPQPQAPPKPQPQAPPKPQPPPRDQPQAWTATILVADDEQDIRELVAYRLSRSGYRIIEARDGEEAFQLAADQALDMAVLDVMMPRLNGFDLTQRLRHTPATARLPILLMSASVQEADISRGFAAGADGYLTKPFTPDQLLTRVREVLSRG